MAIKGYDLAFGPSPGMFYASQQEQQEQASVDSGRMTVQGRASGGALDPTVRQQITTVAKEAGVYYEPVAADSMAFLDRVKWWLRDNWKIVAVVGVGATAVAVYWMAKR